MRGVRRVELVVAGAVLVSAPSLVQAFSGGIDVTVAFVRLAGALVVCWAVGAIVEGTIDGYSRQVRHRELARRVEQARRPQPAALPASPPAGAEVAAPSRGAAPPPLPSPQGARQAVQ